VAVEDDNFGFTVTISPPSGNGGLCASIEKLVGSERKFPSFFHHTFVTPAAYHLALVAPGKDCDHPF
jgi:hypothetical protein